MEKQIYKKEKNKSFWGSLYDSLFITFQAILSYLSSTSVKERLVAMIKKEAVKGVLKKLAITGGFKAWLITFVVEELVEEADEHLIEPAFRKIGFLKDRGDGAQVYRKVVNAQNRDDWRDSVGRA